MNRISVVLSLSLPFFIACGGGTDDCGVTGATQECACVGTTGAQVCEASGDWGVCMCDGADAGPGGVDVGPGGVDTGPIGMDAAMSVDSGPLPPSCTDGIQNQSESDVDCGGTCDGCPEGDMCGDGDDCMLGTCTEAMVCDAPPMLLSSSPAHDAQGVGGGAVITARFSEPLDPASVNELTFVVAREGDFGSTGRANGLPGTLEVDGDTVTFTPDSPFEIGDHAYDIFMGPCPAIGEAPNGATLRGCPGTLLDMTGNMHAGARVTFRTLAAEPGLVRVNSNGTRVYQLGFDGLNAVMRDGEGSQLRLIDEGGGLFLLRDEGAGVELARRAAAGGTQPGGVGATELRNAEFADTGTRFRLRRVDGALTYFFLVTDDGYELATGGSNLQWQQGAQGSGFRFIR